ncbi:MULTISPECIES: 3-phosphoshikimate 1-carboxyvinyltransferase [unclassified Streptomyces]|uniref:3-phosphoshikimate 1-carboxyvinyltransferase n=1 Tax=unclassified Streptomyces TaxID=2593676 RepID=UPI00224FA349|nr:MULTISPECIES: 3-phosphoshikimate 1-carboxyvinyltransferase [unclassified Streptomyces]MCX4990775.1 3-phosphoshikimate 1-carboxyvinyltransferase [Streptomyces sp. NBC_00568]MCX5003994.1 3-phosphoshikimate 1-carboxyvinyltransferase [Streptomyces sp. NBC_00638]
MAVVDIPGSKSITARALFLAAAADGVTRLVRPLRSDDTEGFAEGLTRLGYRVGRTPDTWHIDGRPQGPAVTRADVYCRDGATTARFLPTLAAAGHGTYRFDASAQMRRRPLGPLSKALRDLGVDLRHEEAEGHHPLRIAASGVEGGTVTLDAGQSSQYLTALLLLGPLTRKGLRIEVTDLVSAPYVGITLAMMRAFGADVRVQGDVFEVAPGGYRATTYPVEPDASTASYFFAAAALTGREVTVRGLGARALQGDLGFVDVLRRMGAHVESGSDRTTVRGTGELRGLTVNMRDISDTMPTLAAIAPFASGPVRIEDVANTRVKECDRLEACAENLRRLGVRVETGPDWIEIHPGTPAAAEITTYGDHRVVMAFAVTSLRTPGIGFDDPGCVRKTFPAFHEVFGAWAAAGAAGEGG